MRLKREHASEYLKRIMLLFYVLLTISSCSSSIAPPCGIALNHDQRSKRIYGGHVSSASQWPWVISVRVRWDDGHMTCGGSVIANRWVLTAAHCFERQPFTWTPYEVNNRVEVNLGRTGRNVKFMGGRTIAVDQVIFYPRRNHRLRGHAGPHDIALVQLHRPVGISDDVIPICLPTYRERTALNDKCYVAGWGKTHVLRGPSAVLRHVGLRVTSSRTCSEQLNMPLVRGQLCAVSRSGHGSCKGDSGGPLVCASPSSSRYHLVGVVSYGAPCGLYPQPVPTVFTDILQYLPWIQSTLEEEG